MEGTAADLESSLFASIAKVVRNRCPARGTLACLRRGLPSLDLFIDKARSSWFLLAVSYAVLVMVPRRQLLACVLGLLCSSLAYARLARRKQDFVFVSPTEPISVFALVLQRKTPEVRAALYAATRELR